MLSEYSFIISGDESHENDSKRDIVMHSIFTKILSSSPSDWCGSIKDITSKESFVTAAGQLLFGRFADVLRYVAI